MSSQNVFASKQFTISNLLDQIEHGDVALPDLQRPFVWKRNQMRDLLDSLYSGYPVGFILLWEIGGEQQTKTIGEDGKHRDARFLVIDGQQRLTSLYAVLKGKSVKNNDFNWFRPRVAFHPFEERFEVTGTSEEKDPEWITDISEVLQMSTFSFIQTFIENLEQKREVSEADKDQISHAIERLIQIQNYPFTVLELSSELDVEQISEIFVRVNSKGKELNQSDFVMTVLSVYLPELREEIAKFESESKHKPADDTPSPYNTVLEAESRYLVRTIVAQAFNRGPLRYAPPLLRGRNLETKEQSAEQRQENLEHFETATHEVLNLTHWHDFVQILKDMGAVSSSLISSKVAVFYTYALYLHARKIGLNVRERSEFVTAWLLMSLLTGRYSSSSEAVFQQDLQNLKKRHTPEHFKQSYQELVKNQLTEDLWDVRLPNDGLVSSGLTNMVFLTYLMVLNMENVKILFSNTRIRDVMGGEEVYKKNLLDRHHLFPVNYLKSQGVVDHKEINQVANLCYIEYPMNIQISDKAPSEYFPKLLEEVGATQEELCLHAIPERFWEMEYQEFLQKRRELMAQVIKESVEKMTFLNSER